MNGEKKKIMSAAVRHSVSRSTSTLKLYLSKSVNVKSIIKFELYKKKVVCLYFKRNKQKYIQVQSLKKKSS